ALDYDLRAQGTQAYLQAAHEVLVRCEGRRR
ncbi:MAG: chromosome partitioning protein ParA, partial [Zetaproteobacteria bacterium]